MTNFDKMIKYHNKLDKLMYKEFIKTSTRTMNTEQLSEFIDTITTKYAKLDSIRAMKLFKNDKDELLRYIKYIKERSNENRN